MEERMYERMNKTSVACWNLIEKQNVSNREKKHILCPKHLSLSLAMPSYLI